MSKTEANLKAALSGESQANRKYLAFAKKADEEGHPQVAKLFRAAAEAETVHAMTYLRLLGEINSTEDNIRAGISGETHEFKEMYPEFVKEAEAEGNTHAKVAFGGALKTEAGHAALYQKALESIDNGSNVDYHVCQTCGWTAEDEAPERCPVCGMPRKQFKKIE